MKVVVQHPALKIGVVFVLVLLLNIQRMWLPLLQDLTLASQSATLTTEGLNALQDAYAREPWNTDRAITAGLSALAAGDYETAKTALTVAANNGGWTSDLHISVGDAYNGSGSLDEAIPHWEAALPDNLDNAYLLSKLATAYETKGRYPEASAVLRSLVALEPDNAIARYRYGLVLSLIDPAAASQHLAIAAGLDKSVEPFAQSLNSAVAAGLDAQDDAAKYGIIGYTLIGLREYPLAKAALLHAIEKRSDFADAYAYLGLAEDEMGNDGMYAYQRALEINKDLPVAHYLIGLHYRRTGENQKAIEPLQTAFDLDPANAAAAAELGNTYVALADLAEAENWYRQSVRVATEDGNFWLLLAQFYINNELKVEGDGLLSAQQAAQLLPESATAQDTLGFALYLNSDYTNAETSLLKAIELDPNLASAYFHLGLLYLDTERTAEAKQYLDNAVGLDAGGPIAERAIQALARLGIDSITTPTPVATP
jgi:tetratricopeptide (TPR) repeat protein